MENDSDTNSKHSVDPCDNSNSSRSNDRNVAGAGIDKADKKTPDKNKIIKEKEKLIDDNKIIKK